MAVTQFVFFAGSGVTAPPVDRFVVLKPRDERQLTASQIIDRMRPQPVKTEGVTAFLQPCASFTDRLQSRPLRGSNIMRDTLVDQ
jgi:hypothetical protein